MQNVTAIPFPIAAACGALLASVLSLWYRPRWLWGAVLVAAVAAGYGVGVMFGPAGLWLGLLAAALWLYRRSSSLWMRAVSVTTILATTLLLGMHVLPGFHNPVLARNAVLSPGAAPYTLYFNFDKTFAGILLLGMGSMLLSTPKSGWSVTLGRAAPIIIANVFVATLLSLTLGYVEFQPRWTSFFWIWAVANLLTCVSEEAFFRAFIQREVHAALRGQRHAGVVAVTISALLFGIAHLAGGWRYVVLATIAGFGYALVYQRTERVELSILAHFVLNATHFLLFTYPYNA